MLYSILYDMYDEGIGMKGLSLGMSCQMGMGKLGEERECWQMSVGCIFYVMGKKTAKVEMEKGGSKVNHVHFELSLT
jgi:hypothetical protein